MEKKQSGKKGMSTGAVVGIGAGIAAATVAGYLLFGPEGKKNRKKVTGWAVKMKGEIIEKLENVKDLTEPVYQGIIDEVAAKYSKVKNMDQKDLTNLVVEMRKHWKSVAKTTKRKVKKVTKPALKRKTASKSKAKK